MNSTNILLIVPISILILPILLSSSSSSLTEGFQILRTAAKSSSQYYYKSSKTTTLIINNAKPPDLQTIDDVSSQTRVKGTSDYTNFDYLDHWYPTFWARDLIVDQPTKVSLFDVDYVVAKIEKTSNNSEEDSKEEVIALLDQCPHRSASLSEGRVTNKGMIQCSYHGWTFDRDGSCYEVPQLLSNTDDEERAERLCNGKGVASISANAVALPAMIEQGIVWIFPGGMERALISPLPPRVPELDDAEFRQGAQLVREFPVDFSILVENICDPDHGLFAHGNKAFDLYAASKDHPQLVEESMSSDYKHLTFTSSVDAVDKLVAKRNKQTINTKKTLTEMNEEKEPRQATTHFIAPNMIYMGRRDYKTGDTSFLSTFHICPLGAGRTKLLLSSVGKMKMPVSPPRWLMHIFVNKFLDQDTFLIYSQQKYVLGEERDQVKILVNEEGEDEIYSKHLNVRGKLYKRLSPTEKFHSRLGKFFDETLTKVPNRAKMLQNLPSFDKNREYVLDRYEQSTKHCPDSMKTVSNCSKIKTISVLTGLIASAMHILSRGHFSLPTIIKQKMLRVSKLSFPILVVSSLAWMAANAVKKEFFYTYGEDDHRKDNKRMSKDWPDI